MAKVGGRRRSFAPLDAGRFEAGQCSRVGFRRVRDESPCGRTIRPVRSGLPLRCALILAAGFGAAVFLAVRGPGTLPSPTTAARRRRRKSAMNAINSRAYKHPAAVLGLPGGVGEVVDLVGAQWGSFRGKEPAGRGANRCAGLHPRSDERAMPKRLGCSPSGPPPTFVEIGERLIAVRARPNSHGKWLPWLERASGGRLRPQTGEQPL